MVCMPVERGGSEGGGKQFKTKRGDHLEVIERPISFIDVFMSP